ncbi:MAG: hypothetical protein IJG63_02525 [Oscillospiraceae bacterium]|nr:hypothetical protein [Oscillospiraceae bacterium]
MKCHNCGAEIGDSRVCEFCGTQISSDMLREQELFNKKGCPKCGSTNVTFSREKQGEIRGKGGSAVLRSTVGVCKDCGYTWKTSDGSENVKTRKTWLWVLGWICIFPLPLTILMLRKKDMKPVLKYGIIAVGWLIYLAIAFGGSRSQQETAPATTENAEIMDVTLDVTPNINSEDGTVLFAIETNLPEDTELLITVKGDDYVGQDKAVILNDGQGYTSEFSNNGEALSGKYIVTVSMSVPSLQKDSVRAVIGENGENIGGQYVIQSGIDGSNIVSGDFEFTF